MDSSTGKRARATDAAAVAALKAAGGLPGSTAVGGEVITEQSHAHPHPHTEHEPARPTRSSHALLELVAGITDRYRLIPSVASRYRFMRDVQLKLIATYRAWVDAAAKSGLTLMQHVRVQPPRRL